MSKTSSGGHGGPETWRAQSGHLPQHADPRLCPATGSSGMGIRGRGAPAALAGAAYAGRRHPQALRIPFRWWIPRAGALATCAWTRVRLTSISPTSRWSKAPRIASSVAKDTNVAAGSPLAVSTILASCALASVWRNVARASATAMNCWGRLRYSTTWSNALASDSGLFRCRLWHTFTSCGECTEVRTTTAREACDSSAPASHES